MSLGHSLTIYFSKILISFLWEMKKVVKTLIFFSYKKLSLTGLLTSVLKAAWTFFFLIKIHYYIVYKIIIISIDNHINYDQVL